MKFFIFSIIILLIYPLNQIILKFNYLPSQTGDKHQSFLGKVNVPLTGGLFILMFILLLFPQNIYLNSFLILFFILGIASDKNYISSPLFRFIIQAFFIFLFVLFFSMSTNI